MTKYLLLEWKELDVGLPGEIIFSTGDDEFSEDDHTVYIDLPWRNHLLYRTTIFAAGHEHPVGDKTIPDKGQHIEEVYREALLHAEGILLTDLERIALNAK